MKLELKHLAPNLPYVLKIKTGNQIRTLSIETLTTSENKINNVLMGVGHKPILRPLSDLNKREYSEVLENWEYIIDKELTSEIMWYEWECLFEWHFDVFGLIEKGLAIDINTL